MSACRAVSALLFSALAYAGACLNAVAQTSTISPSRPPGSITVNAPNAIHSMNASDTLYSSIQITNGTVSSLSNQPASNPTITVPAGAAVYPGFIDSHSHAISLMLAASRDTSGNPYWISLANVNVMLLPNCTTPTPGSITCFTPITTQDEVNSLLQNTHPNAAGWILGWNYEPTRMVCTNKAGTLTLGPNCQNFEIWRLDSRSKSGQQTALEQLDKLQSTTPLMVTSESGHIVYVNTPALHKLNICYVSTPGVKTPNCYEPTVNPEQETKLALAGQLDEDIAIYAISKIEGFLADNYAGTSKEKQLEFYSKQIQESLNLYSQLGYTTVQEGAASSGVIKIYMATATAMATHKEYLPVTMAFLEFDDKTANDFPSSVITAQQNQTALRDGSYDMFIAGMKVFGDGSNQGYTGYMSKTAKQSIPLYRDQHSPFTLPAIFSQPYDGLPDYNEQGVTGAVIAAHNGGFPLWVHTNGREAQEMVLKALTTHPSKQLRDVVVHFTMATKEEVDLVPKDQIGVTFLMNNLYYYYQPLCEHILKPATTQNLYPAQWAQQKGLNYGLHSDTTVTPPSPLFSMWVASTRNYQQNNWFPKLSSTCQQSLNQSQQKISTLQAMRAYTSNAAWLYNRDTTNNSQPGIGSLQQGFAGDLVVLSADPLAPNANLSTIYVMYTIHNGNIVFPTSGDGPNTSPSVWPM